MIRVEAEDAKKIGRRIDKVMDEVETVIVGKREVIRLVMASILCNGHILIEDVPGVGKTTLAKSLAKALGCSFKRVQFTPDLLPADITGASVFNQKTGEFEFRPGPVFAQMILADEINRATPKTQSSLLECMEERQVTVDGITYQLPTPFFVIATENNVEHRGTFPLPEAQLDRFMMKLEIGYPEVSQEWQIVDSQSQEHPLSKMNAVLSAEEIEELQATVKTVYLDNSIRNYIVEIVNLTRRHPMIALGSSPRGSLNLSHAARALAALYQRGFVLPDDVKALVVPILAHRLVLKPEARVHHVSLKDILGEIVSKVPVPAY